MHMADALLSPAVGATMWAAAAATLATSARRLRAEGDDRKVPLMGVLGAFVFAAQMINFAVPLTGSSGHLGGGLLLAILLGPQAALLVVASVLVVQALFFADGGLLALGCNIVNLGLLPAFVAYPLVYRRLAPAGSSAARRNLACVVAAVVGAQLGALAVVVMTVASGVSALPFASFAAFMLPIHLAIGVVEGLATAAIVAFLGRTRPELLGRSTPFAATPRPLLAGVLALALFTGGVLSLFASAAPDGLEWSVARVVGDAGAATPRSSVHVALASVQQATALLPDYGLPAPTSASDTTPERTPAGELGTSVAGLVGGLLTLFVAALAGWLLRRRARA